MSKLLSVVIPVYNVEKYLVECLDSVIKQTYKNLQIILVDDGSTDNSGDICDSYAKKDKRITVIHQKNMGAGAAKNTGLDCVKGEYLSIIDSDDFIELDMYEKMISLMETNKVDVVQCGFNNYFVNGSIKRSFENRKLTVNQYLKEMSVEWRYAIFWNKLFKSNLLRDTRFPVGRKIDDEFFTYKLIADARFVYITSKIFCNYRMRKSSVMNECNNERLISDRVDCFVERYEYIAQRFSNLKKIYYNHLSDILLYFDKQVSDKEIKIKINKIKKIYPYKTPNLFVRFLRSLKNKYNNKSIETISFDGMEYFE